MTEKYFDKAFTLVELIVVITILAILGTIGFVSLQGYSVNARDSVRISDTKTFLKALNIYQTKNGEVPLPDDMTTITGSGVVFSYQGTLSGGVITALGQGQVPVDPVLELPYYYAINSTQTKFQILSFMEKKSNIAMEGITNSFANDISEMYPRLVGEEIGFIITQNNDIPLNADISLISDVSSYEYLISNDLRLDGNSGNFLSKSEEGSCLKILDAGNSYGSGLYTITRSGQSIEVYCDMTTDGGGYTMYPIESGLRTFKSTDPNSCHELGMDIIIPRTKAHFTSILGQYDTSYFRVIPGIFKSEDLRNPSKLDYRNYVMNSEEMPDWQALDGGKWWLRDSVYSEPSGDYQSNCWLDVRSISSVENITFNDAWGPSGSGCNQSYYTEKYICSPNDKP